MTTAQFPNRVRLHGGRNTHAARPINGPGSSLVTACDYLLGLKNEIKSDGAVITCRNCIREMNR